MAEVSELNYKKTLRKLAFLCMGSVVILSVPEFMVWNRTSALSESAHGGRSHTLTASTVQILEAWRSPQACWQFAEIRVQSKVSLFQNLLHIHQLQKVLSGQITYSKSSTSSTPKGRLRTNHAFQIFHTINSKRLSWDKSHIQNLPHYQLRKVVLGQITHSKSSTPNMKQNKAQSTHIESTHKGVN